MHVWDGFRQPEHFMDSSMRVVCALLNVTLQTHSMYSSKAREHVKVDGGSVA